MSSIITIENFGDSNLKQQTYIDQDALTGSPTIVVKSSQGAASQLFALLGNQASEIAEIVPINSVTGESIGLGSNLLHDHPKYENVSILYCDQYKVYRAPDVNGTRPDLGTFTDIDVIDIEPEQADTTYIDPAGNASFWYGFTCFNSLTQAETDLSASEFSRGGGVTDYCSITDIRDEAGLGTNKHISDSQIARKRFEAQAEVDSTLSGIYTVPFSNPINPLIDTITCKLAAGFMLLKNYGSMSSLTTNNGDSKVKEARAMLSDLKNRQKVLLDATGNDILLTSGLGFSMSPNSSTTESDGTNDRFFRVSDVQGYQSRRY
jgi:phage gp36-like protein